MAVGKAALGKFSNHLWYLSEEMLGLSLFDDNVSSEEKRSILEAMKGRKGTEEGSKQVTVPQSAVKSSALGDFASERTKQFLKKLKIDGQFLEYDPEEWAARDDYRKAAEVVHSLSVTSDRTER